MRKTDCNICNKKAISLNDTIKIDGKVYCSNCFETHFADQQKLENKLIEREADPQYAHRVGKILAKQNLKKYLLTLFVQNVKQTSKTRLSLHGLKDFLLGS